MKENETLATGNSHIKAVLHYGMAMAVMLHLIALDYSNNCIACGHLHVYMITVILNIPQLYYCQHCHPNFLPESNPELSFGCNFTMHPKGLISNWSAVRCRILVLVVQPSLQRQTCMVGFNMMCIMGRNTDF